MLAVFFAGNTQAEDTFTGEKKAACEAIMCLSTGSPPHECDDSLKKYYKIVVKNSLGGINPRETLKARKNFLKICPKAEEETIDGVNTSNNVKEHSGYEEPTGKIRISGGEMTYSEALFNYDEFARVNDSRLTELGRAMVLAGFFDEHDCSSVYGLLRDQCNGGYPKICWGLEGDIRNSTSAFSKCVNEEWDKK